MRERKIPSLAHRVHFSSLSKRRHFLGSTLGQLPVHWNGRKNPHTHDLCFDIDYWDQYRLETLIYFSVCHNLYIYSNPTLPNPYSCMYGVCFPFSFRVLVASQYEFVVDINRVKFNFLFRDESNSTLKQKPNICIVRTTKTCVHTNTFMLWTRRFLSMCEGSKQLISKNKSKLLKTEKEPVNVRARSMKKKRLNLSIDLHADLVVNKNYFSVSRFYVVRAGAAIY